MNKIKQGFEKKPCFIYTESVTCSNLIEFIFKICYVKNSIIFFKNFMEMIQTKKGKHVFFILGLIIFIFGGLFFAYQFGPEIYAQLNRWKLIPANEHFTELYFENHLNLPKYIVPNRKMNFSFTIHNLEGHKTVYHYTVYAVSSDGKTNTISASVVTLLNGESKTFPQTYTFNTLEPSGEIYVALPQKNQEIHFKMVRLP
jgi:hypothetical protein